ncbi:MAG: hypothetical protein IT236_09405 [Bacteroidia bacterium]|nr:hypothetical protein [Bacteroidia bacterium]
MKKSIQTTLILSLATICLTLNSCKKGDTGPAGPQGTAGTNGVANIQTGTVTTNNSTWTLDNTDNSYNATLTYAAITQSVIDKGTVQVFISDGNGSEWAALPFSYGIVQYNYSYKLGQVIISVTLSNGNAPNNPGGQQFKVVVIPPAAKAPKPESGNVDFKQITRAQNLSN